MYGVRDPNNVGRAVQIDPHLLAQNAGSQSTYAATGRSKQVPVCN